MGGYGSTRWNYHNKKYTVAESLTIDLARLYKTGWLERRILKKRIIAEGSLQWYSTRTGDKTSDIRIKIDTTTDNPHMRLIYTTRRDGHILAHTNEIVPISYQSMNFGGVRTWLHCPACNRRVRTLHNPPGAIRFLCRDCHDLTYVSAQEAHEDDRGLFAGLGMLLTLDKKVEAIYAKLRKTRLYKGKRSKTYKRLQAKLDRYYQDFDKYTQMAQQTRFNTMAS